MVTPSLNPLAYGSVYEHIGHPDLATTATSADFRESRLAVQHLDTHTAMALCAAFEANPGIRDIQSFSVQYLPFAPFDGARGISTETMATFLSVVRWMSSLRKLTLRFIGLRDDDFVVLFSTLMESKCTTLDTIDVSGNRMGVSGMKKMVEYLSMPGVECRSLDVSSTGLDDECGIVLASWLRSRAPKLEELYVNNNRLDSRACQAITFEFTHLYALRVLNMSGNMLGDMGVSAVGKNLWMLDRLEALYLDNVGMGDSSAISLAETVDRFSRRIRPDGCGRFTVVMSNNPISRDAKEVVIKSLQEFLCDNTLVLDSQMQEALADLDLHQSRWSDNLGEKPLRFHVQSAMRSMLTPLELRRTIRKANRAEKRRQAIRVARMRVLDRITRKSRSMMERLSAMAEVDTSPATDGANAQRRLFERE